MSRDNNYRPPPGRWYQFPVMTVNCSRPFLHGCLSSLIDNALHEKRVWPRETKLTYVIFIDFQKMFDTVPHHWLLNKLSHYGIQPMTGWRLIQWAQQVAVNGHESNFQSGVPQGTMIEPLMFQVCLSPFAMYTIRWRSCCNCRWPCWLLMVQYRIQSSARSRNLEEIPQLMSLI